MTLTIELHNNRLTVTPYIFRSWTGRRFIDGVEHHGPVYNLGTETVSNSVRSCECEVCN